MKSMNRKASDRNPGARRHSKSAVPTTFLGALFGSEVAADILLFITINSEGYATQIARHLNLTLSNVYQHLLRFELCGLLVRRNSGKTVLFTFEQRGPDALAMRRFLEDKVKRMPPQELSRYAVRRRPRATGKVIAYRPPSSHESDDDK